MRRSPETITLGAKSWLVRPLTIAQVQAIDPLVFASTENRSTGTRASSIATAIAIVRAGLARDHSEAAAELEAIEADAPEIGAAMAQVLRLGGFLPAAEAGPTGEADAGRDTPDERPASTGPISMQG